jgi:hypothetical protein
MRETRTFQHRSYYVNFASHLLNTWNVNALFPEAPQRWSPEEWGRFLDMVRAFGFTCFEYWLVPTLYDPDGLSHRGRYMVFAETMQTVNELAHARGLQTKYISVPNCISHRWYFACPNKADDLTLIEKLWRHWAYALRGTDIVGIFPGDPGGCSRNGCDHNTYLDLCLRLTDIVQEENPEAVVEVGTWGTPFSGWGPDLVSPETWDGSWASLERHAEEIGACHIWHGGPARAQQAMEDLIARIPSFPEEAMVAINLGFSPDADATVGGDARAYVREIAKQRRINSWDYSVVEGELVVHPHWRLPRIFSRRREEQSVASYFGAMSYTMSPCLSHLSTYAAAQAGIDPDRDPDEVSREFCRRVFGPEHEILGELLEAFEVVPGWGHYPRRKWRREEGRKAYLAIVDHLQATDMVGCDLPLFPSPDQFRQDLLWFARTFAQLAEEGCDREAVRRAYWEKALSIYDQVPMSVDARAEEAARRFSQTLWTEE